jgi:hypothetical protein
MKYKSVKGLLKNDESLIPVTFIDKLEDLLHGFLGIVLFVISVLAAGYSLQRLIETRPFFPIGMIQGINDILFVVIILEIMQSSATHSAITGRFESGDRVIDLNTVGPFNDLRAVVSTNTQNLPNLVPFLGSQDRVVKVHGFSILESQS